MKTDKKRRKNISRENKRKIFQLLLVFCFMITVVITGCGEKEEEIEESQEGSEEQEETSEETDEELFSVDASEDEEEYAGLEITVWVPEEEEDFTEEEIAQFQEILPQFSLVEFNVETVSMEEAVQNSAADVFLFTQEYLDQLVLSKGLEEIPEFYAERVMEENDEKSIEAATSEDGVLYAYPCAAHSGYFLYYDASVITNPSCLEQIVADCEAAGKTIYMELNSGWYQPSFFFGTGCSLSYEVDGEGNFVSATIDYASSQGVVALREMIELASSSAFQNGSAAGNTENMAALVGGIWDEETVQELLGENTGYAKLPSFVGSDGKEYDMSGFAGWKLFGVAPQSEENRQEVCHALASWLTSTQMQALRFESNGEIPTNLEVQNSEAVLEEDAISALLSQMNCSYVQRRYPGDYWTMASSLGDDIVLGSLKESASDEELLSSLETFEEQCLSYTQ